jgi:hypothetical protein
VKIFFAWDLTADRKLLAEGRHRISALAHDPAHVFHPGGLLPYLNLGVAFEHKGRIGFNTLVAEYTNFAADADGTARKRLTERWKRLDDTHLLYGFTMHDPGTRTKPYSVEFVMWRLTDQEQLVEYACHEGNVNLEFTLSGARAKEREEEEQQ